MEVIIVGGSNYNELGLVRSFGVNKIRPIGIFIGKKRDIKRGSVIHSRYWKATIIVPTVQSALNHLIDNTNNYKNAVIITTSDFIMQEMDAHYEELSRTYTLPSFQKRTNGINQYVNKKDQVDLVRSFGFDMLSTEILDLEIWEQIEDAVRSIGFPMFLKPVQGGEGSKYDITPVKDKESLIERLEILKKRGYSRILAQPYIENKTEILLSGAISPKNNYVSFTLLENIRLWPPVFGVGSFSSFLNGELEIKIADKLLHALLEEGYSGPIDIEFFKTPDGKMYINEINWRTSGRNWISLFNEVYSVVWWAQNEIGINVVGNNFISQNIGYAMCEFDDFMYVVEKKLKYSQWKKAYKETNAFAARNKNDWLPCVFELARFIKYLIRRKKDKKHENNR